MQKIQQWINAYPLTVTSLLVIICVVAIKVISLFNYQTDFSKDMMLSVLKLGLSLGLLVLVVKLGWLNKSGLTTPLKQWHKKWWLAMLPIALIGLINLLSVNWQVLAFSYISVAGWLFNNLSTGIFEELLLRGVCFLILFRAWQHKENALIKAAFAQAIIFGLAHLGNLQHQAALDVFAQVIYATLLGISFAGVVTYTRSLWPAIGIHTFINSMGDINNFFEVGYVRAEAEISNYIVAIILIFLLATLPGLLLLKKARNSYIMQPLPQYVSG